jgi:hypothetical protein
MELLVSGLKPFNSNQVVFTVHFFIYLLVVYLTTLSVAQTV